MSRRAHQERKKGGKKKERKVTNTCLGYQIPLLYLFRAANWPFSLRLGFGLELGLVRVKIRISKDLE